MSTAPSMKDIVLVQFEAECDELAQEVIVNFAVDIPAHLDSRLQLQSQLATHIAGAIAEWIEPRLAKRESK